MAFAAMDKIRISMLIVLIITGVVISLIISETIKKTEIERTKNIVADFTLITARDHIKEELFHDTDYSSHRDTWVNFFGGNLKTPEMIRIKVWNKDATVIYSDAPEIVGKQFPENEEFQKAINGEVEVEIKSPLKPENVAEAGYRQLMELYVPISFGENRPVGVIELYYSMDRMNETINSMNIVIWVLIGAGLVVSFLYSQIVINQVLKV